LVVGRWSLVVEKRKKERKQMQGFKDLRVWQESMKLVKDIYQFARCLPDDEKYVLVQQMRRRVLSVPSNIAEGSKRGQKDFARFIEIASGSLAELETQVMLAFDLYNLKFELSLKDDLFVNINNVGKMLKGLHGSLSSSPRTTNDQRPTTNEV
jgi:four helix bundle protein